jgi:hypothetical protein
MKWEADFGLRQCLISGFQNTLDARTKKHILKKKKKNKKKKKKKKEKRREVMQEGERNRRGKGGERADLRERDS